MFGAKKRVRVMVIVAIGALASTADALFSSCLNVN